MNAATKIAEVRMSKRGAYLTALAAGTPLTLSLLALAEALQHKRVDFGVRGLAVAIALFLPLGAAHELLHGLAAVVHGRLRWRDLHIRVHWRAGVLACHVRTPIRVRTARVVLIAPLIVTGLLVLSLLWRYPCDITVLLAGMVLVGCVMDLLMLWKLRRFDANLLFVDHPSEPAFDICSASDPIPRGA